MKYAVVGLLLFALAGGAWYATKQSDPPPAPPPVATAPDAGAAIERPTGLDEGFEIPEEMPDAATPTVAEPTPRPATRPAGGGGGFECGGDIPVAAVRSTVGANSGQVRQCYEHRLRSNPNVEGSLRVQMRVGSNGAVSAVNLSGSLHDPEVLACVRERVRSWHFQAPTGGDCAIVAVPFTLTARQ